MNGSRDAAGSQRSLVSGPLIATALRSTHRPEEADAILGRLDRRIGAALARSRRQVTADFLAQAAQTWALQGKSGAAIGALEQARARGWLYVNANEPDAALLDIGDEPAFRTLRGNTRFERLRAGLNAHLARERDEIRAALHSPERKLLPKRAI